MFIDWLLLIITMKKKVIKNKQLKKLERFRLHHKAFFSLVGVVGIIAIWRGIWTYLDYTPLINHPFISIIIGIFLAIISGVFFKLL